MPSFQTSLLKWYHLHKRDLPWRRNQDPYRILVSEIMLQQTQVQTVIPYYRRWLKTFPSFRSLAAAPLDQVLKQWEGLGYYSRARNLHKLAQQVVEKHKSRLPDNYASLIELPGIGRYSAGAILSIAFDKDYPVLDGNVIRVFSRYFGVEKDVTKPETRLALWSLAEKHLHKGHAGDYNQALMELGAMICVPKHPRCGVCPVRASCISRLRGWQDRLPLKKKAAPTPHYDIGAGVIWRGEEILISQRPLNGLLGGLWEFPGGKREPNEELTATVAREIKEELGIVVRVGDKCAQVPHAYSHFRITLHAFHCHYVSGKPQALGVKTWKWVRPEALKKYAFPAANQPIIQQLMNPN